MSMTDEARQGEDCIYRIKIRFVNQCHPSLFHKLFAKHGLHHKEPFQSWLYSHQTSTFYYMHHDLGHTCNSPLVKGCLDHVAYVHTTDSCTGVNRHKAKRTHSSILDILEKTIDTCWLNGLDRLTKLWGVAGVFIAKDQSLHRSSTRQSQSPHGIYFVKHWYYHRAPPLK